MKITDEMVRAVQLRLGHQDDDIRAALEAALIASPAPEIEADIAPIAWANADDLEQLTAYEGDGCIHAVALSKVEQPNFTAPLYPATVLAKIDAALKQNPADEQSGETSPGLSDQGLRDAAKAMAAEIARNPVLVGSPLDEGEASPNAIDRLRMFAADPKTFEFDQSDAIEVCEAIDAALSAASIPTGARAQYDLQRSMDYADEASSKAGRDLWNVIDWRGEYRGQIALTVDEADALVPRRALSALSHPAPDERAVEALGGFKRSLETSIRRAGGLTVLCRTADSRAKLIDLICNEVAALSVKETSRG